MVIQTGVFLQSTELLKDTAFDRSLVFIADYNEQGALGFVVNKPFGRTLNELVAFRHSPPFPLYEGGPVDKEHLFFLHRRPELIKEGKPAAGKICLGGDFGAAVKGINNKTLSAKDIKLFVGYCGWDAGDLEAELAEGSWTIAMHNDASIFV